MANIMLALAGINGKRWDINYLDIVNHEKSGANTILVINDRINGGNYRLLIALSIDGFERLYNDAKSDMEHLQTITFEALSDIQKRHNEYFQNSRTNIKEYITIYWVYPVQIEFSREKELPGDVKNEIMEKFRILE